MQDQQVDAAEHMELSLSCRLKSLRFGLFTQNPTAVTLRRGDILSVRAHDHVSYYSDPKEGAPEARRPTILPLMCFLR